jgi:glutamate-1-semialdehyde 2,1-aminomutase
MTTIDEQNNITSRDGQGQRLYKKALKLIPGGTQLLSKRPELYLPNGWPAYYKKASGCRVWDLDGREYIDMSTMGIGACILGYADPDVNGAVKGAIDSGNMSSLNAPEEVACAELLISLHPWADMVRFARTGGESMAIAVRIARSYSRKDIVMFCGYHGWHDWYLSANLNDDDALGAHLLSGLSPTGVPGYLKGSSVPFYFNDLEDFRNKYEQNKNKVGAIVLESVRNDTPTPEFIATIQQICHDEKAVFIVDEITSGFRLNCGGAHLVYGFEPDIAVFAKGISNGYPMAAILGKEKIMQAAQDSFISSTYWTEKIGPTAAIATIKKMQQRNVPERLITVGQTVQDIWRQGAEEYDIPVDITGIFPLSHMAFKENPLVYKTLFTQQMLKKGFLAPPVVYSSFAHEPDVLAQYRLVALDTFREINHFRQAGHPEKFLEGPVCHAEFKRLN